MSDQPDHEQPSTSRGPLPGVPHGLPSRARLPEVEIVAPPAGGIVAPPAVGIVAPPAIIMVAPAVQIGAPPAVEIVAPPAVEIGAPPAVEIAAPPAVERVAPLAVADEDVEMQEPQDVPATPPRDVAEPGFLSKVMDCVTCVPCVSSDDSLPSSPVRETVDPDEESARRTHHLSNYITRVQCFLLPTSRMSHFSTWNKKATKFLGFCVRLATKNCDPLCYRCADCGVCPHMYSCTCSDRYKHKGTKWCAHIHTMHTLTKGKFGKTRCLYIHTEINYTLLRHVRAVAQGGEFMRRLNTTSPLCYEAVIDDFDMSPKAKVEERLGVRCSCSRAKRCIKCSVCRCKYTCSCFDYVIDEQVCQHIQKAAMMRHSRSGEVDSDMPEFEFSYLFDVLVDENMRYYVELEHEMSFYIDLGLIREQTKPIPGDAFTDHYLQYDGDRLGYYKGFGSGGESARNIKFESVPTGRNVASSSRESFADKWWVVWEISETRKRVEECKVRSRKARCICDRRPVDTSCSRCNICSAEYECTCPLDSAIICRHIHAVHRLDKNIQETVQDAERRSKDILFFPALRHSLPDKYANWPDALEDEASQRKTAVLPAPTD